ncbi:MAG: hypothetical protein ABIT20_05090 [Gemmatimonadaceae bacterium]
MTHVLVDSWLTLLLLAIPIACVSWSVTHEEVFREPREWCEVQSRECRRAAVRKMFYLFTCEYCFSHYVAAFFLFLTHFTLLMPGWRGYVIAEFALVWVANMYMSLFGRLRLDIKHERVAIAGEQLAVDGEQKIVDQYEMPNPNGKSVSARS